MTEEQIPELAAVAVREQRITEEQALEKVAVVVRAVAEIQRVFGVVLKVVSDYLARQALVSRQSRAERGRWITAKKYRSIDDKTPRPAELPRRVVMHLWT